MSALSVRSARFELRTVRVALEAVPGVRGRRVRTPDDAARLLARWIAPRDAGRRLAAALLDEDDRVLAVALRDRAADSACCLRPSEVWEPALLVGATRVWLAHAHASQGLWATRQDIQSAHAARRMGHALGLTLVDHVILGAERYASLNDDIERLNLARLRTGERRPLPAGGRLVRGAVRDIAPSGAMSAAGFTLLGLRPIVTVVSCDRDISRRRRIASHDDMAALLPRLDASGVSAWSAALVDQHARLTAVAQLDNAMPLAQAVYRAAIALDARQIYLARRHTSPRAEASAADLRALRAVHAMGFELGRPLTDALIFGARGDYASLRTLGIGVEAWRQAVERSDPSLPDRRLRLHQQGANRRPAAAAQRRVEAARAAVWRCVACQRRQIYKRACLYCGALRAS